MSLLDCINANSRTALELVYAEQLFCGRLTPIDEHLEAFLRSIISTPTLDDIQPYFDSNIRMAPASSNTSHAHSLSAYNVYYNKFIGAYGLFKTYFDEKMLTNHRAAMHIIQTFFVQGLQPRVVRDLMGRDKDIQSLKDLRKRFEFVLTRIRAAHVENTLPAHYNNNPNNNRGKSNPPPRSPPVPPTRRLFLLLDPIRLAQVWLVQILLDQVTTTSLLQQAVLG